MSKVRSKDGTAIAFDRSGQGPAVILVDGAFCSRAFGPMGALAPLLAERLTVFKYDRRGRNESGDTAPYAVEREIEDIDALIAEAGGTAYVYGISSGAGLALEAAARGVAINRLALYEPPYVARDSNPALTKDPVRDLKKLVAEGRRGDAVEYFMTKVVGLPLEHAAGMRQSPAWPALEGVAPTLVYDVSIMGDYKVPTKRFASIKVPTIVIGGGASPAELQNAVRDVANAVPNAQRRMLEGQTHEVSAEAIAPVLIEFFSGVTVAA
jgi:pimeloyl-ACP methyl ester carboxylesterase